MSNHAIEDLTLRQLILLFVKRPARTWKAWKSYLADPDRESSIVVKSSADGLTKPKLPVPQRLFDLPRIQLLLFGIAAVVGLHGNKDSARRGKTTKSGR